MNEAKMISFLPKYYTHLILKRYGIVLHLRRLNTMFKRLNTDTCNPTSTILKLYPIARFRRLLFLRGYKSSLVMQHNMDIEKAVWNPIQIFQSPSDCKYAIIVLNRPILWSQSTMFQIWQKAQVTITVDGGTHRWVKYLEDQGIDIMNPEHKSYVPNLITGDMDSSSPVFIEKMHTIGSSVIKTPDQSHTDYTKALIQLREYIEKRNINLSGIYVLAETSGRFDHIIANINTLYKSDKLIGNIPVIQVASNSLTWLLRPGFHSIAIPESLVKNHSWCGLIPFGSPVTHITTTGLKWNLNEGSMQFGALVSTSNTYDNCSEVTVDTDTPVIWTMGIEPLNEEVNDCVP